MMNAIQDIRVSSTTPINMAQSTHVFRFYDLPAELRLEIYKLILVYPSHLKWQGN